MNTSQKQTKFIGKREREQAPLNPNPEKKAKMDLSKLANIIKSMPTKSQEKKSSFQSAPPQPVQPTQPISNNHLSKFSVPPHQQYLQNLNMVYAPFTYSSNFNRAAPSNNKNNNIDYYSANIYNNPLGQQMKQVNNYPGIGKLNYNFPIATQSYIPPTMNQKQKYVIKDIPEMTVGNFLNNKGIQDMYLNKIKKRDDTDKSLLNTNSHSIINTNKPQEPAQNITNVNINNINYNYNITPNNNIIVQTKTVAPKILNNNTKTYEHPQVNQNKNQSMTKKNDFPPSLQNYITRAFQRCKNNEDIEKCHKILMSIMENTMNKKDMMTRDWDSFPLPDISKDIKPSQPIHNINNQHQKYNSNNNSNNDLSSYYEFSTAKQNKKNNRTNNIQYQYGVLGSTSSSSMSTNSLSEMQKAIESYKPIIGTCTDLEKTYYRMTEHPDPSQVRPEYILKKSLKMLTEKWKKKTGDYLYVSEQFRSIRQDLTVQQIQNEFSIKVYETHARIALESYDLPQFNQCQTALIPLYDKGIKGNSNEFFAYRILYTALYEKNEMINIMALIKEKFQKKKKKYPSEIEHAIKTLKALNEPNYFAFFKLYSRAPNMGCSLIEPFLPRLRIKALQTIAYGFYSEIDIEFVREKLSFKDKKTCVAFLEENKLQMGKNKDGVDVLYGKVNIPTLNECPLLQTLIQKKIPKL